MISLRKCLVTLTLGLAAPMLASAAFPDQPIRVVVGFPPGTAPDIVARSVGQEMINTLGESVVIDNRTGAGGQIAAQAVARADPDGYTLLFGEVGSLGIAPAAYDTLNYDVQKDFTAITEAARADFVLVVPASSPYKTVQDFITAAKSSKDRVNFGTFGAATPGHFGAELFARQAGFKIEAIHYRSTGDAVSALVSGGVDAGFLTTAMAKQQVADGKMRALATSGKQRASTFPDLPTLVEAGYPNLVFSAWMVFVAPKNTPADTIAILHKGIVEALNKPSVQKQLGGLGLTIVGSSSADLEKLMDSEIERWREVVVATGFKSK